MKKLTFLFIVFIICLFKGNSQQTGNNNIPIDSIMSTLQKINLALEEKNYTRIPNKEFDEKISTAVKEDIDSRWTGLLSLLGGIGAVLFAAGFAYIVSKTKESSSHEVEKKFNELTGTLTEKISHVYLTTVKDQYEKQINDLEKMYTGKISELDVKMKELDVQSQATKGSLIQNEVYKIRQEGVYSLDQYNKLKGYLADAEKMKDNRLLSEVLNDLSYAAYYNKREPEFLPVLDKYLNNPELDIKENSLINIASGMFYNYASSKSSETKDRAISYIDKSLEKISDYGEALGLKLEFYMVELESAINEDEKQRIKREAELVMDQISSSQYASKETISRFNRVITNQTEKKYIEMISKEFPQEMKAIRDEAKKQTMADSNPENLN